MTMETNNETPIRDAAKGAKESKDTVQVIGEGAIATAIWKRQGRAVRNCRRGNATGRRT